MQFNIYRSHLTPTLYRMPTFYHIPFIAPLYGSSRVWSASTISCRRRHPCWNIDMINLIIHTKIVSHAVSTLKQYHPSGRWPSGWYWFLGLLRNVIRILVCIILYIKYIRYPITFIRYPILFIQCKIYHKIIGTLFLYLFLYQDIS